MVNTPVLFETFVRVEYARQVWEAIKEAQPKKLYFYSNKGRAEKEGEIERNNEIRSWVKEIDWDCELHTWFRDECVDVYTSLLGAISWLFENEEQGIVLEDDCVPSMHFFAFCDKMLRAYKDNDKVWYVSGDNFLNDTPNNYDIYFTRYHFMYGWATWRDRWKKISFDYSRYKLLTRRKTYHGFFKSNAQAFQRCQSRKDILPFVEKTKCWDYLFGMECDLAGGYGIVPSAHLVHNIGLIGENHSGSEHKVNVAIEREKIEKINNISLREPQTDYDYDYHIYRNLICKYRFSELKVILKYYLK